VVADHLLGQPAPDRGDARELPAVVVDEAVVVELGRVARVSFRSADGRLLPACFQAGGSGEGRVNADRKS